MSAIITDLMGKGTTLLLPLAYKNNDGTQYFLQDVSFDLREFDLQWRFFSPERYMLTLEDKTIANIFSRDKTHTEQYATTSTFLKNKLSTFIQEKKPDYNCDVGFTVGQEIAKHYFYNRQTLGKYTLLSNSQTSLFSTTRESILPEIPFVVHHHQSPQEFGRHCLIFVD